MLRGLTVQSRFGLLNGREGHDVVVFTPFFNLEYLGLVFLGEEVTNSLLIVHVRHENSVALFLLAPGRRRFGRLLWLRCTVSFANNGLVHSRKQTVTAQSSTEAEYMAVSEAAKQAIWIRHFLHSIGKETVYNMAPTTIYEDNQGAIKLADNPVNHPKTKHIAVRYHAIREHIANGEIRLEYLPTDRMVADGLTKATNHVTQERLVDGLGLA